MMKKKLFFLLLTVIISQLSFSQFIYNQSFTTIDGGTVSMSTFQGKKILIIIAPVDKYDSTDVKEIATFQSIYGDSVKLIGILSNESGYLDSNKVGIKNLFQSKGIDIVLTAPMYTKREAGLIQGTLMKWLTDRALNKRFGMNSEGVGQKFFIDETGRLFSVLNPSVPLLSPAVYKNIQRKPTI